MRGIIEIALGAFFEFIFLRLFEQVESLARSVFLYMSIPSIGTITFAAGGISALVIGVWLMSKGIWSGVKFIREDLHAEIFGEKGEKFLVGGTIGFKARYEGNLKNGYFTVKLRPQERAHIQDTGREYEWMADYNTYNKKLNGKGVGWPRKSHTSYWGHKIPFHYPSGNYRATVMVYDETSTEPLKDAELSFTILKEDLQELHGLTTDGDRLPSRSMFVRNPRRRDWLGTLK